MSKIVSFNGYGVGAETISIIVERITHFYPVEYNGCNGVVIELDSGKSLTVAGSFYYVKDQINQALDAKNSKKGVENV